jgi:hypothetical protein
MHQQPFDSDLQALTPARWRAAVDPILLVAVLAVCHGGTPARAAPILPAPTTLAHCAVDTLVRNNPSSCTSGSRANAFGSLTLFPFVTLTAQAASPPNDNIIRGAAASVTVTYSLAVTGGNPGDFAPILIATSLSTVGTDTTHGIGFAEMLVHTND